MEEAALTALAVVGIALLMTVPLARGWATRPIRR